MPAGMRGMAFIIRSFKKVVHTAESHIRRLPDRFMLPAGTACGFHHTQHSKGTCMGVDLLKRAARQRGATTRAPRGWIRRYHFDMGSGSGNRDCSGLDGLYNPRDCGYFVWCEYTDPTCVDSDCVNRATKIATVGIMSNTDETGTTVRRCPPGTVRTSFYDDGRGEGEGLSFCRNTH